MHQLSIIPTGQNPTEVGHIGSVIDVIAARLPPQLEQKRFNANHFAYGFELGTPLDKNSLGETILLNGVCYTTSTDKNSSQYYHTISGSEFMTSGIFLIPHTAKPSHTVIKLSNSSLSLNDFHQELYDTICHPLTFVALVEFDNFHSTAISKPPLDGKDIFQYKNEYYTQPALKEKNIFAFIMGVLTDFNNLTHKKINQQLEVVLYHNPFDTQAGFTQHTHALTLNHPVNQIQDITVESANRALHLFSEGSTIRNIYADIYTISHLQDYQNA